MVEAETSWRWKMSCRTQHWMGMPRVCQLPSKTHPQLNLQVLLMYWLLVHCHPPPSWPIAHCGTASSAGKPQNQRSPTPSSTKYAPVVLSDQLSSIWVTWHAVFLFSWYIRTTRHPPGQATATVPRAGLSSAPNGGACLSLSTWSTAVLMCVDFRNCNKLHLSLGACISPRITPMHRPPSKSGKRRGVHLRRPTLGTHLRRDPTTAS